MLFAARRIVFCSLFVSCLLATEAVAQSSEADGGRFELRVQTHFSQGWNLKALTLLPKIGAPGIRDGIYWRQVETRPGVYDTSRFAPYFNAAHAAGADVLPVFSGAHPAYDGGNTPYTDEGRKAFARYVAAVVERHPDIIGRLEIGNEYNTNGFLSGPFESRKGAYYGPLIKEVALAVKAVAPETEILCTGAHSVATGYFREVFESGALDYCDAISFHPYRDSPENVDAEIERLKALMREFGGEKPLYVTEFGDWFKDKSDAPDFMIKMTAMMAASGVSGAYWYALLEQEYWPNMGLFTDTYEEQPAAAAFRFLQDRLLPVGRPAARGERPEDRIYEFGSDGRAFVVWGAPGDLVVEGEAQYFDSSGNATAPVSRVSAKPVVIMGTGLSVRIARERNVYSASLGFGMAPWSYHAHSEGRADRAFRVMDGNWNPYIGHPNLDPMTVTPVKLVAALFGEERVYAVERFTVPDGGLYEIEGRWWRDKPDADGADIVISRNGKELARGVVAESDFEWRSGPLELEKGDRLDFALGPNMGPDANYAWREITITGP